MGDHADDTMNFEDEAGDHFHGDGDEYDRQLQRFIDGTLRRRQPQERTSTMNPGSFNSRLGRWGEGATISKLQKYCDRDHRLESTTKNEISARIAILNSQVGDIRVLQFIGGDWIEKHTVEVKVSERYHNCSISVPEFNDSTAKYLVAVTLAGMWATTMESARNCAIDRNGYLIVPHDTVKMVRLQDVVTK